MVRMRLGPNWVIRRVFSGLEKIPETKQMLQILPVTSPPLPSAFLVLVLTPPGAARPIQGLKSQQSIIVKLLSPKMLQQQDSQPSPWIPVVKPPNTEKPTCSRAGGHQSARETSLKQKEMGTPGMLRGVCALSPGESLWDGLWRSLNVGRN